MSLRGDILCAQVRRPPQQQRGPPMRHVLRGRPQHRPLGQGVSVVASAEQFDVVIVGGGPAGSATALQCLQAGLRVAILEAELFPRHRPGETLPPGIEALLTQLGVVKLDYPRFNGQWVAWEGAPRFECFGSDANGPWRGFHAWRPDFDAQLLRQAVEAGARVLHPQRALNPVHNSDSRIVAVVTDGTTLECRFVVDASGARHWLARHLGLPFEYASPKIMATYGYCDGQMEDGSPRLDADRTGWTWMAQVRPSVVHWTRLSWSDEALPRNWAPAQTRLLRKVGRSQRADVTWRITSAPAGPGYFIVGDAAIVFDPSSSHGVLRAVMSGMMAGYLITEHISVKIPASKIAAEYNRWLSAWFSRDASRLRELYARLPCPPSWLSWLLPA